MNKEKDELDQKKEKYAKLLAEIIVDKETFKNEEAKHQTDVAKCIEGIELYEKIAKNEEPFSKLNDEIEQYFTEADDKLKDSIKAVGEYLRKRNLNLEEVKNKWTEEKDKADENTNNLEQLNEQMNTTKEWIKSASSQINEIIKSNIELLSKQSSEEYTYQENIIKPLNDIWNDISKLKHPQYDEHKSKEQIEDRNNKLLAFEECKNIYINLKILLERKLQLEASYEYKTKLSVCVKSKSF